MGLTGERFEGLLPPARRPDSGACQDIRRSNRPCVTPISTPSVSPDSVSLPQLNSIEPPWYGPVCPLVGEGRHREVSPYPDQSLLWVYDLGRKTRIRYFLMIQTKHLN